MEPALSPAAPDGGQQLATNTFHLTAGQEVYMCYQFRSPSDAVAITHVSSLSAPGVHHLALFQAFGRDEDAAPHECATLIRETWQPIFVSGTGAKELALPDNTGFTIEGSTQYILQLHLQNTSDADIDVRAGINLTYNHTPSALIAAGIYGIGNDRFTIPANATDFTVTEHCDINHDMNVFAVFPHMHKLGTTFAVTQPSTTPAAPFYTVDPWEFGNQPIEPLAATLHVGDKLDVTCHWDNHADATVGFGESSDNEMCYFVMFYAPYGGLDGCID